MKWRDSLIRNIISDPGLAATDSVAGGSEGRHAARRLLVHLQEVRTVSFGASVSGKEGRRAVRRMGSRQNVAEQDGDSGLPEAV